VFPYSVRTELVDSKNAETDYGAMLVHALDESVMSGLTHEPGRVAELLL
jgi:hypothetical protein